MSERGIGLTQACHGITRKVTDGSKILRHRAFFPEKSPEKPSLETGGKTSGNAEKPSIIRAFT